MAAESYCVRPSEMWQYGPGGSQSAILSTMATDTAYDWKRTAWKFAVLVAVYMVVVYLVPKPASVKPEGWRLTGIFVSAIVGSILQPVPAGALVLAAVTLTAVLGGPHIPLHPG